MRRLVLCALAAATIGGCSPDFRSVRATAALGEHLREFDDALDELPRRCATLSALSTECAPLASLPPRSHRLSTVLGAYAASLDRSATGGEPVVKDEVDGWMARGAAPAAPDALAGVIDTLSWIAAHGWPADRLSQAIVEAGPRVDAVVAALATEIALQRQVLAALGARLGGIDDFLLDVDGRVAAHKKELAPSELDPVELASEAGLGTRAAIALLRGELRDREARLARYDKTLRAFGEAHRQLAQRGHLDETEVDRALFASIAATVEKIFADQVR